MRRVLVAMTAAVLVLAVGAIPAAACGGLIGRNGTVNLVKTTTLAYAIAVPEMLYVANQIWSDEVNVPEMMTFLLIAYVALVGALVWAMNRWERAMRIPGYGVAS